MTNNILFDYLQRSALFPLHVITFTNYIGAPAIGELIKAIMKIHGGGAGAFTRQVEEGTFCIQRTGARFCRTEEGFSYSNPCE